MKMKTKNKQIKMIMRNRQSNVSKIAEAGTQKNVKYDKRWKK